MLVIFYHMSQRLPGVMRLLLRFPALSSRYLPITRLTTRDVKFHFVLESVNSSCTATGKKTSQTVVRRDALVRWRLT
jgi:hypothetical protein